MSTSRSACAISVVRLLCDNMQKLICVLKYYCVSFTDTTYVGGCEIYSC